MIETHRLSDGAVAILPRAVVDLDYTVSFPGSDLLARSSNGLASGNGRNETLVHAICEAVERDSVSTWYLSHALRSGERGTGVELRSVDDPWCREQLDCLEAAGLDLIVWHATGRVALPTFVASLIDRRGSTPYQQRASGYGGHVDAGIALSRAINEAAQGRLTAISRSRDDNTWAHYANALPAHGSVSRTRWASVSAAVPSVDFRAVSDAESFASTDLSRILVHVRDCLANAGLDEVNVTDLGRPGATRDAGFTVLHVSVPGLQANARKFHTLPDPARLAEAGLAELAAASAAP